MAKYDKETKFYWLQLKEDFFEEDSIEWLEEQDNGHKYSLFYLKLCLKSLKSNGVLIRKVGNMLVPYDNKKLAEMTNTDIDTVIVAMELLKGIGLVQVLDNGELYITQLENMIGSTSKGALKKAQQRALKKEQDQVLIEGPDDEGTKGGHLSTKDKDKDKTKVKVIEKNIDKKESKKIYGEYKNIRLSDKEYQSLVSDYGSSIAEQCITYLDEYIEMKGSKYKSHYLVIKKWVVDAVTKPKTNNYNKVVREEIKPSWLGKEIEETPVEELSEEQKSKAEELRRRLREKYGKEQTVDVDEVPITLDF